MGRGQQQATPTVVLPARSPAPGASVVDAPVVLAALTGLAAADTPHDVAAAALQPLCALPGVRAGAVARSDRRSREAVLLASSGYDCATMAPGARLPLDAGLPLTDCLRTGLVRVVGTGPSWVAVPAGTGTALLLSLTTGPPDDASVAAIAQVGAALAGALHRARRTDGVRTSLLVLEEGLAARPVSAPGLVVRSRPYRGPLSGDVVEAVPDGTARWLLVADVCGRGHPAAVGADRLRSAFRACAPGAAGPVEVLQRLDRAVGGGEEDFATALVLRAEAGRVRLASAGHPAPLQVPGGRVEVAAGPPLGLHLGGVWPGTAEVELAVPPGTVLLLATDGLVDRGPEVDLDAVVAALPPGLPPEAVADAVLEECAAVGPAQDDETLVVLSL